jgi:hypothetical protein
MKLRCLATLVLALFVGGLFSTAEAEVLHSTVAPSAASQGAGTTCPDPGKEGDPCGPDCPCACCPGHRPAATFPSVALAIVAPAMKELVPLVPVEPTLSEIGQRIFHPPRA